MPETKPEDLLKHPLAPAEREIMERELLGAIRSRRAGLEKLLAECSDHWGYEDPIYRFYHQSFKVVALQSTTVKVVEELRALLPARELNDWFVEIVREGTGRDFDSSWNKAWLVNVRPIVEAFFHARFMLEMAVCYAGLEEPPQSLPSGWAALLYLFNLR